jgi:hypothetical protein
MHPTGLTFLDLQTRVARYLRKQVVSSEGVSPPVDVGTATLIKDAINDGLMRVTNAHQWAWLEQIKSIVLSPDGTGPMCVDGDATKYRLPLDIGSIAIDARVKDDGCSWPIDVRDSGFVDALNVTDATGPVSCVSFDPSIADGSDLGQPSAWIMRVYPKPASAATVVATFRLNIERLVEDADRGPWPVWLDRLVMLAAVAELGGLGMLPEGRVADASEGRFQEELERTIELDSQNGRPANTSGDSVRREHELIRLVEDGEYIT